MAQFNESAALERFLSDKPATSNIRRMRFPLKWKWAAAVLVIALGVSSYFFLVRQPGQSAGTGHIALQDIPPGKNGAILTLADGTQVVLDSLANGKIATQSGTEVLLNNNELVYDATAATGDASLNTITTPNGRQYHVTLPDGTEAWLNAASSIEYPVAFKGGERRVKITGRSTSMSPTEAGSPLSWKPAR